MDYASDFQSAPDEDNYDKGDGIVEDVKPDIKTFEVKPEIKVSRDEDEDGSRRKGKRDSQTKSQRRSPRKKCQSKSNPQISSETDEELPKEKPKKRRKQRTKTKRSETNKKTEEERRRQKRESTRKYRSQLPEEKRQKLMQKWREEKRRRRENETEEQRQERLRKMREYVRRKRRGKSGLDPAGPEEGQRPRRSSVKREQGNNSSTKDNENESEELQREERVREYRKSVREKMRKYRKQPKESDEDYQKRLDSLKEEDPEEFEKCMGKLERERFTNLQYKIKRQLEESQDPEKKKDARERKSLRRYLQFHALPPEEQEEIKKKRLQVQREWREKLEGEKLERYKESLRNSMRKYFKTEKFKEYQKKWKMNQTPEQRQKTLHRYKVNQAKRKLKLKLQSEGCPQDEIERRVKELHDQMWSMPLPQVVSAYEPKPRRRKDGGGGSSNLDVSDSQSQSQSSTKSEDAASGPGRGCYRTDFTFLRTSVPFSTSSTLTPTLELFGHVPSSNEQNVVGQVEFVVHDDGGGDGDYADDDGNFNDDDDYMDRDVNDEEPADLESGTDEREQSVLTSVTPAVPVPGPSRNRIPIPTPEQNICKADASPVTKANVALRNEQVPSPSVAPVVPSSSCKHCGKPDSDLRQHMKTSHPKHCWKCPKCGELFLSPPELSVHFKTHTTSTKSPQNARTSNGIRKSGQSSLEETTTNNFNCVKCGSKFATPGALSSHVQDKHPEAFFLCRKCNILKYSAKSLEIHSKFCKKVKQEQI